MGSFKVSSFGHGMMRHLVACALFLLCSSELLAQSIVIAVEGGDTPEGPPPKLQLAPSKEASYALPLAATIKRFSLMLSPREKLVSVEHRYENAAAVGAEGPWMELPIKRYQSGWVAVSHQNATFAPPQTERGQGAKFPKLSHMQIKEAVLGRARKELALEEFADPMFSMAAEKCLSVNAEPCYVFHAADIYRITTQQSDGLMRAYRMRVEIPGGC